MSRSNVITQLELGGTYLLGSDFPIHRLGFGAMHIPAPDLWGQRKIEKKQNGYFAVQ